MSQPKVLSPAGSCKKFVPVKGCSRAISTTLRSEPYVGQTGGLWAEPVREAEAGREGASNEGTREQPENVRVEWGLAVD